MSQHIPYKITLMHRDDLLREAAKQRLASRSATSARGEPTVPVAARPRTLRRLLTGTLRRVEVGDDGERAPVVIGR
jgi:hypothetical protein